MIRFATKKFVKYSILFSALVLCHGTVLAQIMDQIVYIDGMKYKVHQVEKGETLYSLSKLNSISMEELISVNPALKEGLKSGAYIKIPVRKEANQKSAKKSRKNFNIHEVQPGETTYQIAKKYGISVETILEDNLNLDPTRLTVGQDIYIRRSETGKVNEEASLEEIRKQSEIMSTVSEPGYEYIVLGESQSLSDIAHQRKITIAELLSINSANSPLSLKEGSIIKVPKVEIEGAPEVSGPVKPAFFKYPHLRKSETAKVNLVLPFTKNGKVQPSYLDFYQGFLLGLNDIRMKGHNVILNVFDSRQTEETIENLVRNEEAFHSCNLTIGPVYQNTMNKFLEVWTPEMGAVVSPLANISEIHHPAVYQMAPTSEERSEKIKSIMDWTSRVLFIKSDNDDPQFEKEMRSLAEGKIIEEHKYIYEHTSVIEKRERARLAGQDVPYSAGDFTPLMSSTEPTTIVVLAANETNVDRILAAVASAVASLSARSRTVCSYQVIGSAKWNRYTNIDKSLFFDSNVRIPMNYYYGRASESIKNFDDKYSVMFSQFPSAYSYRGYDAAMIFVEGLWNNHLVSLNSSVNPLETIYRFSSDDPADTKRNINWPIVMYNSNYTVSIR